MPIKAIYFDLGGVIVRTVDKTPRAQLGAEFGLTYDEMDRFVFECETAVLATTGKITEAEHWSSVVQRLKLPESDVPRIRDTFFSGDSVDWNIINFLREQRQIRQTGLISNAWDDLRAWIISQKFDDAFDYMTISAEVKSGKPAPEIYRHALEKLGVKAEEAIFVDDVERNVAASVALGMNGIQFRSAEQALADIHNLLKVTS